MSGSCIGSGVLRRKGTEDAMKLGSRFCLILEYLAAEDHRAVDDDVPCLDYDKFCLLFLRWCHVVPRQVRRVDL